MSLSLRRVVISSFTFFFFVFFFLYILSFFTALSYSYAKERSLKDHRHFCKCFRITLTFSSFNIRLADTPVGVQIGVRQLTNVMFIVGVGNLIVNILPIQRRFLLNIAGANKVDIFIDYRAASTDQFNSISEMIATIGVQINFVEKGNCSIYKQSQIA